MVSDDRQFFFSYGIYKPIKGRAQLVRARVGVIVSLGIGDTTMKPKNKRVRYPNALLAAARSAVFRPRVVEDKTKHRRPGREKRSWINSEEVTDD